MPKGKRGAAESEDLDLVPIMNLVTILIPFLLMASSFVTLAAIDSTLPAIGEPQEKTDEEPEETLNLSIAITDAGFTVLGSDATLKGSGEDDQGATIPCARSGCPSPDAYDVDELRSLLIQIKDRWEDEENVILIPESHVPYEVIVLTMDASREDPDTKDGEGNPRLLFPNVVIAGGAQ